MIKLENVTEFYYWLQGAIEIGGLDLITREQANLISNYAKSIPTQNWFTFTVILSFELCELQKAFSFIKEELQKIFIHDVDSTYEGDQEFFHDLHQGKKESL